MADVDSLFDELRDLRVRPSFAPFTIVTKAGARHTIAEQSAFAMDQRRLIAFPASGGPSVWLRWDEIDRVERFEPAASPWATMEGDYLL